MNNYCLSNNKPQGSCLGIFRIFLFHLFVVLTLSFSSSVAAAILSGTVYLSGDPLPNTTMNLIDSSTEIVLDSVLTDGFGAYRFTLENGNYRIGVAPPANLGLSNTIIEDVLINSADLTYHIVLLQPAVVLSGVVRAPDGTPVNNVELSIFDAISNLNVGVLKTKTDGSYSFPLAGGNYYINV